MFARVKYICLNWPTLQFSIIEMIYFPFTILQVTLILFNKPTTMYLYFNNCWIWNVHGNKVRKVGRPNQRVYKFFIKWNNLSMKETSWKHVKHLESKIEEFKLRQSTSTSTVEVRENVLGIFVQDAFVYGRISKPSSTTLYFMSCKFYVM